MHVVWFKRDLRLHDHTPLAAASAAGAVLPLYMVEPMLWRQPDAAARHWRQVRAALAELADDLRRLDLNLIIRTGEATEILSALHAARPIEGLEFRPRPSDRRLVPRPPGAVARKPATRRGARIEDSRRLGA